MTEETEDILSLRCDLCGFDHGAALRDRRNRDAGHAAHFAWYESDAGVIEACGLFCCMERGCFDEWRRRNGGDVDLRDWTLEWCVGEPRLDDVLGMQGALAFACRMLGHYRMSQAIGKKIADFAWRAGQIPAPRRR